VRNVARDDLVGGVVAVIVVSGLEFMSGIPLQAWALGVVLTAALAALGARQSHRTLD
jgi:hypothetical protein